MTNLRLKEVAKEATNKDFYNSFFTASRVTKIIGFFGQFVSAATEFHFIYSATGGTYDDLKQYSNILPFLLSIAAVYVFEVIGVRVYLVRIIRQIVNKDFKGFERKILFVFNTIFVLALCGANLLTSVLGQKHTFTTATNVTTTDKTHQLELEKTAKIDRIKTQYNNYNKELAATYQTDKTDLINRYKTDIYNLKNNRFAARDDKSKYNAYTAKIDSKIKAKTADLSKLKNQYDNELKWSKETFLSEKNAIISQYDKRINDISKVEQSNINLLLIVQKYTLPILVVFILLSWFAIVYTEIFIKGSGQKIEVQEVKKRPVLIVILLLGLYEKLYLAFYWLVARIVGTKKYIFDDIKKEIVKYELQQKQKPQQQLTGFRQIGFVNKKSDPTNVTNLHETPRNEIESPTTKTAIKTQNFTNNDNRITKVVQVESNYNRTCKNCKKGFVYKHHKQLYCSDRCRIANWESRTGKKLKKRSKK